MKATYYDHDFLWEKRKAAQHPVWGSNSHRVYRSILELLATRVILQKSMLDVGCGAGAFGVLAAEAGFTYFGVDASSVAIDLGQQSYPGVQLKVADAVTPEFLKIVTQTFPVVTCVNVLHCLTGAPERNSLLNHLRQVCEPKGLLVLTTMIGPVSQDAVETRLPRAYKLTTEIINELNTNDWSDIAIIDESPADQYSKIGNLMLIATNNVHTI